MKSWDLVLFKNKVHVIMDQTETSVKMTEYGRPWTDGFWVEVDDVTLVASAVSEGARITGVAA